MSTVANVSRTVRFTEAEIKDISDFLDRNPFFDFSTLARLAIGEFVRNPRFIIQPIVDPSIPTLLTYPIEHTYGKN